MSRDTSLRHGYDFPGLYLAIERAKGEIRYDIRRGIVPPDIPDFPSLHDYTDANEYGGICVREPGPAGGPMSHDEWIAWGNAIQSYLDDWLKGGRP